MRPVEFTLSPATDANGIAILQTTGAADNLLLDGTLVNAQGIGILQNIAQPVDLTSAGNLSGITFTIFGADADGRPQSETITGPNATKVVTTADFTTVTRISSSGAVSSTVSAGVTAPSAPFQSRPVMLNIRPNEKSFKLTQSVELSGGASLTYTVQFTTSNLSDSSITPVWTNTDNTNLITQTVSNTGNIFFPVRAVRLNVTVFTSGTAKFINISDG